MTSEVVDALGELLNDYLGKVIQSGTPGGTGYKGVYSVKELRVMHTVFRHWRLGTTCTLTQIARETGISKTTVSRAITTLITNGLLKEQPDPEDGRRRLLEPTSLGQRALDDVHAWLAGWAERIQEIVAQGDGAIIAPEPAPHQRAVDAASR